MAQVNYVWVVRDQSSVTVFSSEKKAREDYAAKLEYYKNHKQPNGCDGWVYDVWMEVDEPTDVDGGMHYACVKAKDKYDNERDVCIQYARHTIL